MGILEKMVKIKRRKKEIENKQKRKDSLMPDSKKESAALIRVDDITKDILTRHAFPKLERMEKKDQDTFVNSLQVLQKVKKLGIKPNTLLYPELNLKELEQQIQSMKLENFRELDVIIFLGTTSKELQKAIDKNHGKLLDIRSDIITVSETITVSSDTHLQGNGAQFVCSGIKHVFLLDHVSQVSINGIVIKGNAEYGISINNSSQCCITECTITAMSQKPICVLNQTTGFQISNNDFAHNLAGGIYIAGEVSKGLIQGNKIEAHDGTSNWMAGIVLTDAAANVGNIWETFGERHHFPRKCNVSDQKNCPHEILIRNNQIAYNRSSGIYSDGAYSCFVIHNTVRQNDKEGICLDYGTFGFYLKENVLKENGKRGRQDDKDLEMDFVLAAGRMEDGSAKAKLPGISIDNAAYNILENNIVSDNYGGGIKMVRTALRNLITENIIKNNNCGQNDCYHFFGIEVGAAIADVPSQDIDFTPDFENIMCRNSISGNHYSGIFIGQDCYVNDAFDNVIMDTQQFAVEAISIKFNSIVNNVSNMQNRNEYK